ncbi:MAG TPA: hypothetical protein VKU02_29580, partial [Gemmataceae bacterium]|nr:hypothetical protein [Gemmataceae bacterium]
MRRMPQNSHRSGRSLRLPSCRPTVEVLEDRLPPGDILLGQLLNSAWVGQGAAVLGSGGNKGWMQPEPAASEYRLETLRPAVVAEAGAVASVPFFAACFVPGAGAVPETIGEAGSQQPRTRRPDYAELAGLDEEELDRLIEDDFDTLASTTGGVAPPRRAPIGAEDTIRSGLATAQESAGAGATTPATAGQAAAGVPGQGSAPPGSPGLGGLGAVPAPFPLSNVPSALLGTNPTVSPFAVSGGSGGSGG